MQTQRRIYDQELYVHFVTFSVYHRRRLLDLDRAKRVVLGVLQEELNRRNSRCLGFVIMPDHVHALIWFPKRGELSSFMQGWKRRSSLLIRSELKAELNAYLSEADRNRSFWQRKYYSFEIYEERKLEEKLNYMHMNPVRAGLVQQAVDWNWSSARWYAEGKIVGVRIEWVP